MLPHLVGSESDLSTASCTAPDVAVVAEVSDAVSELGLEAYLTSRVQIDTSLPLSVDLLLNLVLKAHNLLLLEPEIKKK